MAATTLEISMLEELISEPSATRRRPGRPRRQDRTGETEDERRSRKSAEQAERRKNQKAKSEERGSVLRDADTTRQALADAAMILLQRGGPIADEIEAMLAEVFRYEVGAPMSIRAECVNLSLKPKYLSYPEMSREERVRRIKLAML
ncbi:hypothetical protein MUO32_26185 [Shinella sp. CPCC 101442]|uniref:hypothetical protein n=1 Tax=Shinella sp. CPCC 101442 TaxID=2932265 RepID=UPI0021535D8B|nr:hypothetical protein [Shinella sp. CPCC 101442]MCR6502521.1 hypothetical protein [Shinella sp. CPCC 101442]